MNKTVNLLGIRFPDVATKNLHHTARFTIVSFVKNIYIDQSAMVGKERVFLVRVVNLDKDIENLLHKILPKEFIRFQQPRNWLYLE